MSEICDYFKDGECLDDGGLCSHGEDGYWERCPFYSHDSDGAELAEAPAEELEAEFIEVLPECVHLDSVKGMCRHAGCSYKGMEKECPEYEPHGRLKVEYLDVRAIDPHPDNPRRNVGDVSELAESIRAEGIQQPLTVVDHVDGIAGRYTAVIGHRRLEAAKKAGLREVPAFVRKMNRRGQLRTMMTENTQREDLTPLEEADGFQQLMLELPEQTAAAVARETGFSETTVRRRMKLLELPRDLAQQAEERGITLADYEKLAGIKDPERKAEVLKAAGTEDFDRAVKDAKDREEKLKHRDRLVKELKALGVAQITAEEARSRGDLESQAYLYEHRWKEGEGASGWLSVGYVHVFYVCDDYIRILRVRKDKPKGDADEAARKAERERRRLRAAEEMETLHAEMEQLVRDFQQNREVYVGGYDKWERNREEIMAFAVRMMLTCVEVNVAELAKWLDIATVKDRGVERLEEKGLRIMLNNCPEKALLYTAYWCCEGKRRSYTQLDGMDYELNTKKVFHAANTRTDLLYEALAELGYLMSEDERKWQAGTLPQYKRAKEIGAEWKKS